MPTVTEHLRRHLEEQAGIVPRSPRLPDLEILREQETAPLREFMDWCDNRLVMGKFRGYHSTRKKREPSRAYVDRAIASLEAFWATGNVEHAVDAVNFIRIEAVCGVSPDRYFGALDDAPDHLSRPVAQLWEKR